MSDLTPAQENIALKRKLRVAVRTFTLLGGWYGVPKHTLEAARKRALDEVALEEAKGVIIRKDAQSQPETAEREDQS